MANRGKVHTFLFPSYTGTFIYDAQRPEASKIELTLAANAMKCVDARLNSKDLKSVQVWNHRTKNKMEFAITLEAEIRP
jgi:hypothetical protein